MSEGNPESDEIRSIAGIDEESAWPGVEFAYDFVVPSYDWALRRYEASNGRLQNVVALTLTVTTAVPILSRFVAPDADILSPLFLAAVSIAAMVVIGGALSVSLGELALASPARLFQEHLGAGRWEFKKNQIYWAGQHLEANIRQVNRKVRVAFALTVAFSAEIGLLIAWLGQGM